MTTGKRYNAEIEVSLVDHFTNEVRGITRALKGLEDAQKKSEKASKWAGRAAAARDMADFSRDVAMAAAKPIETYIDFEKQMTIVAAKSGATAAELAQVAGAARSLGATTQFSASQAAQGFDAMASAGYSVSDQLRAMPAILELAAAGFTDIETAATLNTDVLGAFQLGIEETAGVTNKLVGASNTTKQSIDTLVYSLKNVAPVAAAAGASVEDVLGLQGALAAAGIRGSNADTVSRALYSRIQAPDPSARKRLKSLNVKTNDDNGNLRDLDAILADIKAGQDRKYGAGKGGTDRAADLKDLFGEEAIAGARVAMDAAVDGSWKNLTADIAAYDASAAAEAATKNTAGALAELDSAVEEVQLTIGESLKPTTDEMIKTAKDAANAFGAWAKENPELVKSLGYVAIAITGIGIASAAAAAVMMVNPIVAIVTGIALAAVLIYQYWEPISAFFEEHWGKITAVFAPFMIMLGPIIGAAKLLMDNWEPVADFFTNLWNSVTSGFKSAMDWILEQIKWVGDKVTDFRISIMSPDEFAAYEKEQAAAAEANARAVLGGDTYDAPGLTTRGGLGDTSAELGGAGWGAGWQDLAAKSNAEDAMDRMMGTGIYEQYGPVAPSAAQASSQ
mgnify:CR=1 FL=1